MGKVGVLCEFSGTVRDAFIRRGHDAVSCDLLDTESPGPHIKGDCLEQDWSGFDLLIMHPPCTHLAVSGARWFKDKRDEQALALAFVWELMKLPVKRWALENPVSIISSRIRKPDQIIQPWQFGDSYSKTTCLWLKNLPHLSVDTPIFKETEIVDRGEFVTFASGKRLPKWYSNADSHARSKTFPGIANAMADQWGSLI